MLSRRTWSKLCLLATLWFVLPVASAQSLPVSTTVAGNTATIVVGSPLAPVADVTLTFDDATNLSASSLGVQAQFVDLANPALLARLPPGARDAVLPRTFEQVKDIEQERVRARVLVALARLAPPSLVSKK